MHRTGNTVGGKGREVSRVVGTRAVWPRADTTRDSCHMAAGFGCGGRCGRGGVATIGVYGHRAGIRLGSGSTYRSCVVVASARRENIGDEAENKRKDESEPHKMEKRADFPRSVFFGRGSLVLRSTGGGPQHEEQ